MARTNFVAWRYTADDGTVYVRRADSRLTSQTTGDPPVSIVGGESAAGLSPYREMPRNLKPRQAIVKEAGVDFKARVVIYTPAAFAALVTGTSTIEVTDGGGTAHLCVVLDKAPEPPKGVIGA